MIPAIILAGGLGTRLRGAVPDLPKPMAPVNGRPFLEHQLGYWVNQGIEHFMLSVGYKHEVIERNFGTSYRGAKIDYSVESEPLGTGGGLLKAMAGIPGGGLFLVLNGDTFFKVDLTKLLDSHRRNRADITLSLFCVDHNTRYTGIETDAGGRLTALNSAAKDRQLINGGVYLINPDSFAGLPFAAGDRVSLENELLAGALASGKRLFGHTSTGPFIDIGIPEDYVRAANILP